MLTNVFNLTFWAYNKYIWYSFTPKNVKKQLNFLKKDFDRFYQFFCEIFCLKLKKTVILTYLIAFNPLHIMFLFVENSQKTVSKQMFNGYNSKVNNSHNLPLSNEQYNAIQVNSTYSDNLEEKLQNQIWGRVLQVWNPLVKISVHIYSGAIAMPCVG